MSYRVALSEMDELHIGGIIVPNQIDGLTRRVDVLSKRVNDYKNEMKLELAVFKLHKFHELVSSTFEEVWRKWFKNEYDPAPSMGRFLRNPPKEEDGENYKFWNTFLSDYPGTDNKHYQTIYAKLNGMRAPIAHPDVEKLKPEEFDVAMKMVFPDYGEKTPYIGYRDWLYLF